MRLHGTDPELFQRGEVTGAGTEDRDTFLIDHVDQALEIALEPLPAGQDTAKALDLLDASNTDSAPTDQAEEKTPKAKSSAPRKGRRTKVPDAPKQ